MTYHHKYYIRIEVDLIITTSLRRLIRKLNELNYKMLVTNSLQFTLIAETSYRFHYIIIGYIIWQKSWICRKFSDFQQTALFW